MDMDSDNNDSQIIDTELGLSLANNKADLAENLLKMLVDELPATKMSMLAMYNQKDYEALRKEVHKLHGGCCYCGVPRLKTAAAALDNTLKSGNTEEAVLDPLVKTLAFEIEQVLACYSQLA